MRLGTRLLTATLVFAGASEADAAAKTDYATADKLTQSAEGSWNPRAGLVIEADVAEVEPNNTCPGQSLACGSRFTQATLTAGDVDFVNFTATEGQVILAGTESAGGLDPDTKLTLFGACGSQVLATDDDGGPGLFSLLNYLVPASGSFTLRIEGIHPAVAGDYAAFVSCVAHDPADVCSTAPALPCGSFTIASTTIGAKNDYDLTSGSQNTCTSYATAGADVVYVIPQSDFTLSVSYTSTADGALYLITDCANPRGSCVAGSDFAVAGEAEGFMFTATEPGPYYLVLDNFVGDAGPAGDFTLTGYLDCPPLRWVNVAGYTSSGPGMGAAWGDYDGDGDEDIYLSKYGEANKVLKNNGAGSLGSVTLPPLNFTGYGRGVAWADHDNDGDLDLYLANGPGANKLFTNDGAGGFSVVANSPVNDTGDGRGVAWGDFDNDGHVDLFVANAFSSNKLFRNLGGGTFIDATTSPLDGPGITTGVAWGDYDNDGDLDLYLAKHGHANQLLRNEGGGNFTDATTPPLDDAGNGRGVAWGDYDNDGDLDLYLTNALTANKLFRNDGAGVFTDVTTPLLGDTGDGRGLEWGDFDNDGDLDLYIVNSLSANKLFENRGPDGFVDATSVTLADVNAGEGTAAADYDNDGDLDLYLVNSLSFDRLFRNDLPAGNHWLHVDLTGTLSNRSGIGARVRIVAGGQSQIRDISGGSGHLSQGSLTAEFGLGTASMVDTVEVRWPSGIRQESLGVTANQRIRITERDPAVDAPVLPSPRHLVVLGSVPDPFNPSTKIRYLLPQQSTVNITIYDARGRAVRHLFVGMLGPGVHEVPWAGTDDRGAALASGTYVARVDTEFGSGTEKLTLLK